jgi:phage recombination protein Bet
METPNTQTLQTAQKPERGKITYQSAGQDVTLSYQIVRDFLTKGDGQVTDQDLTQFISICKYNQLNPFLNEAYLVKYGAKPAQMIVSKEAYMKRAEACDTYEGIQAGIIVLRSGEAVELEGSFYLPEDKLVGGWAKVYRSDRKFPFVAKIRIEEYDKKQSTWNAIPSTMITKVAKVQALREAFPAQLGAMYIHEEVQAAVEESNFEEVSTSVKKEVEEKAGKVVTSLDQETPPAGGPAPEAAMNPAMNPAMNATQSRPKPSFLS